MASQRLPFLYPHLFKSARWNELNTLASRIPTRQDPVAKSSFSSTAGLREQAIPQRYGTAQEPLIPPSQPAPDASTEKTLASVIAKKIESPSKARDRAAVKTSPKAARAAPKPYVEAAKRASGTDTDTDALREPVRVDAQPSQRNTLNRGPQSDLSQKGGLGINEEVASPKPLEKVYEMPAPTVEKPEEHKAPHLQAPPYVHHFDTFTLVNDLQKGGFTEEQSVSLMKAVRALLWVNLDFAREGLVGKSDVENETYLFRAACSELRTEILNLRRSSQSTRQTQLHHLQHSADILSQQVTQQTLGLKDDLKGMLNDRRMASREQSQQRDSEISELNYRISARLNSDSKSEVEGLRWVLTRRAVFGIAGMALLILGSLRYGSYRKHEMEVEAKRKAARTEASTGTGSGGSGSGGGSPGYTVPSREMSTQTNEDFGGKGESVGYVSLG